MTSRGVLRCAIFAALALAAMLPPARAMPQLEFAASGLARAWFFACSMLLGAAPYLAAGALAAATLLTCSGRLENRPLAGARKAALWRHVALPAFAILFPGCDCAMNSFSVAMRRMPSWTAGFAIVWGSCCNPLALVSTAAILGPRMVEARMSAGFVAALLTALAWTHLAARPAPATHAAHTFFENFLDSAGSGIISFSIAAAVCALSLVFLPHALTNFAKPPLAAVFGALLSPCSTADALLARVLFHIPASQIAFILAAQCLDVRQIALLRRSFGVARTVSAAGAAALACVVGCFLVV